jgi:integrase
MMESSYTLERTRYITPEEFEKLLSVTKHEPAWYAFYACGNLGLRASELIRLRPSHLYPARKEFEIETLKQKKGKPVRDVVPASRAVLDRLKAWAKKSRIRPLDLFWPISRRTLNNWWYRWAKEAGLYIEGQRGRKGRGIHALRHLKAFSIKAAGGDIKTAAMLMRHRSIGTTLLYWHTEDLQEVVEDLGEMGCPKGNGSVGTSRSKRRTAR